MAVVVIAGKSNSGKTTSLRFLPPETTFIINMNHSKDPTFPGFKKNFPPYSVEYIQSPDGKRKKRVSGHYCKIAGPDKYAATHAVLKDVDKGMKNIKYLVVDDINYIMGDDIMGKITEKSRDKFSGFAKNYTDLIEHLKSMREDLDVIIVSHTMTEQFDNGEVQTRLMSVVKSIDKYKPVDSQFDYIFYCECLVDEVTGDITYVYRTRKNGDDTCRSVLGMFKDKYIEPNIYKVLQRIHAVENGEEEAEYPETSSFVAPTVNATKKKVEKKEDDTTSDTEDKSEVKTEEEDYEI